jgi:hypothetical protein
MFQLKKLDISFSPPRHGNTKMNFKKQLSFVAFSSVYQGQELSDERVQDCFKTTDKAAKAGGRISE